MNLDVLRVAVKVGCCVVALGSSAAVFAQSAEDSQSMFNERTYRSLIAESKAARVGDVLTVVVQESSSASSTADLRGQRGFSLTGGATLTGFLNNPKASGHTSTESDGSGRTQRSGRLLAQLSVQVTEVLPNGDLLVSGQQSLKINKEEQLITLSGVVRPRDIADGNTVLSSRIAMARIQFDGEGFVTDQSKPSWVARLFNFLGM